jgi:hypothetical protein
MANEQDRSAIVDRNVFHFTNGFLLEFGIAYGEDFVHHQNIGLEVSRYGKSQSHPHS